MVYDAPRSDAAPDGGLDALAAVYEHILRCPGGDELPRQNGPKRGDRDRANRVGGSAE